MSLSLHYIIFLFMLEALSPQPVRTNETGNLTVVVKHMFGSDPLKMDQDYSTLHQDLVALTTFKYYLSNVQLTTRHGVVWRDTATHYLIDVNDETSSDYIIQLNNVPAGDYMNFSFSVGIDSVRNHSGAQEGALNPDYGMFWMWETGYVFFKLEGFFKSEGKRTSALVYHIGRDECYRTVTLQLAQGLNISSAHPSRLTVGADVKKVFGGFSNSAIDLRPSAGAGSNRVMGGETAPKVANNFAQIFSVVR